ncbi:hypothetical protein [Bacillus sp. N447-1]|nr:hypothetical protein [Bacillus sp. N447-1]
MTSNRLNRLDLSTLELKKDEKEILEMTYGEKAPVSKELLEGL